MRTHDVAEALYGTCSCNCHRRNETADCWCLPARNGRYQNPPPFHMHHNDWVHIAGACPSPHHLRYGDRWCDVRTDADVAAAIRRHDDAGRARRLRTGRPRGSDINWAVTHPTHPDAAIFVRMMNPGRR